MSSMVRRLGFVVLIVSCCPWNVSRAGVYVGIGVPGPYYRPYYRHGYRYGYRPYGYGYGGVYIAPPPVIVGAPPVVVPQPVVVQPGYTPASPPPTQTPAPLPPPAPVTQAATATTPDVMPTGAIAAAVDVDSCVRQLQSGDEQIRSTALVNLGKLKAERAVGPMVKALNSDRSPRVREAAARGLGLIASPSSLSALQYAAQADDDTQVRHSAAFAVEVIRGNTRR